MGVLKAKSSHACFSTSHCLFLRNTKNKTGVTNSTGVHHKLSNVKQKQSCECTFPMCLKMSFFHFVLNLLYNINVFHIMLCPLLLPPFNAQWMHCSVSFIGSCSQCWMPVILLNIVFGFICIHKTFIDAQ